MKQNRQREDEPVDVLIVGSGSAGLSCALWLAIYNHRFLSIAGKTKIKYRVLERRDEPLRLGQADGLQCRTVEIFESWGLGHSLRDEGYWVNEVCFWAAGAVADANGDGAANRLKRRPIARTGRTADVMPDLSHQPHLTLNQARVNGLMLEKAQQLHGLEVEYGWDVRDVQVDRDVRTGYPVCVTAVKAGVEHKFHSKYLLGGDGAHSAVRKSLGIKMIGDSTNATWGVMDVFCNTNFPDIRKKCTIRADIGNLLIIPREGGFMVRLYFQLPEGTDPKHVTLHELQEKATLYFYPYRIQFVSTSWWSAYSIGQRLSDRMCELSEEQIVAGQIPRAMLGGDACHTHSPKAGQGMNASLQDGYNLGWKLGAVLSGQCGEELLSSYVTERHGYAEKLINFDRYWSSLFSNNSKASPQEFSDTFIQAGVFTAGMATSYAGSSLTNASMSTQSLADKVVVGKRCPSAQLVRLSDAKPMHLQSLLPSNGSWRILVFAGNSGPTTLDQLGTYLASERSPYSYLEPPQSTANHLIETLLILHGDRTRVEPDEFHPALVPIVPDTGISDINRIFFDDESYNHGHGQAYQFLGIDPDKGCIIVVRPDQYVSAVVALDEYSRLEVLFQQFLGRKPRSV